MRFVLIRVVYCLSLSPIRYHILSSIYQIWRFWLRFSISSPACNKTWYIYFLKILWHSADSALLLKVRHAISKTSTIITKIILLVKKKSFLTGACEKEIPPPTPPGKNARWGREEGKCHLFRYVLTHDTHWHNSKCIFLYVLMYFKRVFRLFWQL